MWIWDSNKTIKPTVKQNKKPNYNEPDIKGKKW
jgi:hypothetical protein